MVGARAGPLAILSGWPVGAVTSHLQRGTQLRMCDPVWRLAFHAQGSTDNRFPYTRLAESVPVGLVYMRKKDALEVYQVC